MDMDVCQMRSNAHTESRACEHILDQTNMFEHVLNSHHGASKPYFSSSCLKQLSDNMAKMFRSGFGSLLCRVFMFQTLLS